MKEKDFIPEYNEEEINDANKILGKYFDSQVMNNGNMINRVVEKQAFLRSSMKRSIIKFSNFIECRFNGVAFSGSIFDDTKFYDSNLKGNSFICSNFKNVSFKSSKLNNSYISNNFSQSNFNNCTFENIEIEKSTLMQCYFKDSTLFNCKINASTLENTTFDKCRFENVEMSRMNLDFLCMKDCKLENVTFPFYQFPYLIGSADYIIKNKLSPLKIYLKAGAKQISLTEYTEKIEKLIIYFSQKNEYFPMSNLYYAIGEYNYAKDCIRQGILNALIMKNFRMIKHLCRLGKFNNILDSKLANKILDDIDCFLLQDNLDKALLNDYLNHTGEIRTMLLNKDEKKDNLQVNIKTTIMPQDREIINILLDDLHWIIDNYSAGNDSHFIEIRHNSPYDVFINVFLDSIRLLPMANALNMIAKNFSKMVRWLKRRKAEKSDSNLKEFWENEILEGNIKFLEPIKMETKLNDVKLIINNQMKEFKNQKSKLTNLRKEEFSEFIDEITQRIIINVENIIDPNLLVFKIKKIK